LIRKRSNFLKAPNVVRETSFHRWRNAQRLVNTAEVVVHEVKRHRMAQVLDLL